MRPVETINVTPQDVPLTTRPDTPKVLTSGRAGVIQPLWAAPLLREDRVGMARMRVAIQSEETVFPIMNPVKVVVSAHFVPFFAFERFAVGMDAFNRSYMGQPEAHNGTPIPFFQTIAYDRAAPFWRAMGIHEAQGATINASYLEAYNTLVNFRRKARSSKIALRAWNDTSLAQAFWHNPNFDHIVPEFEQAAMDGQVPLVLSGRAPVSGIGIATANVSTPLANITLRQTGEGGNATYPLSISARENTTVDAVRVRVTGAAAATARADIWAELQGMVGQISLANIELAKQTAAMAKVLEQYEGLSAEHVMNLLMDGVRVPDEMLRQPVLLAQQTAVFGFNERFATDAANLDKSRSNASAVVDLTFRTPPMNTGGILMITAEIVPEPLFERQADNFLRVTSPSTLPAFVRDFLDPDQVEVVENRYMDVLHSTPTGIFGYAPMNHAWKRNLRRIGGKFFRPNPDSFVENRLRFWSVEKLNPALVTDFYLVPSNLPHTVFADANGEPFEFLVIGGCELVGNTQFGQRLIEDDGAYAQVDARVDKTRVVSV